jgi:hypothetical protein
VKLHKLDPPKRFEITAAPPGEFLTAQKLFERYNLYPPLRLKAENDELLRMYINNYQSTKKLVPYIVGRFTILDSRELGPDDIFTSGVAAVAESADYPQVLLEHVYTCDPRTVLALKAMLRTGLDVRVAKTLDLAAIIHIQRLQNGSLQFTAVPLLYGSYALKQGEGTFSLEPPPGINLVAGLPIIREPGLDQTLQMFAEYQRENTPVSSALDQPMATPATAAPATSELVRLNANPAPEISVPMHGPKGKGKGHASPAPAAAIAATGPAVAPISPEEQRLLAMDNPQPRPLNAPADAVTTVTPEVRQATAAQLAPTLQSAPVPVLTNNDATWRTYAPGQMPGGRVIEPTDAAPLADSGLGGERLYLRGDFVVTAAEENRAVLRPQAFDTGSQVEPDSTTRVIVQYPAGTQPPAEGSTFARDDMRPFMITDVRRGADGQINLYVREITTAQ